MSSCVVVALRVKAPPTRAFEVFTRDVALWWEPSPLFRFGARRPGVLAFEPREGGRFTETQADGEVFEIGRITTWEPGARLVFSWRQASFTPEQVTEVEVRFEPVGEETRVTVEHRGWDGIPPEHVARHSFPNVAFLRRHAEWWQTLLASLRATLERGDGIDPRS